MIKKKFIQVGFILLLISPIIISCSINFQNHFPEAGLKLSQEGHSIDLSLLPEFDNDSLNLHWEKPNIEMLIISPNDPNFISELIPLAEWKNEKGIRTEILSNYSSYEGTDNAEKIRNMIKDYHGRYNIRWVLLAGDTDIIPIRYVYNPDVIVVTGESEYSNWDEEYKPTDFYYASLEGTWDEDGDGIYGESPVYNENEIDEIDWTPEVYVGRFPASNALELQKLVNKTLNYEKNPLNGSWMNQMLLAGGISSYSPPEDESRLTQFIWQNYTLGNMRFTHLNRSTPSFHPLIPPYPNVQSELNHSSFTYEVSVGYSAIIIAGHGDPTLINDASGTTFFTNTDALNTNNIHMPSLFYADACTTSSYDVGDNSMGERMIIQQDAGAIGYIGALRVTWYLEGDPDLEKLNRANAKLFWQQFFEEKKFQQGKALFDSKVEYLNSDYFTRGDTSIELEWQRKNILTYNLLGDPEVDIYTNYPINASKNFLQPFHAGQLVNITVFNAEDQSVPYASINLITSDGKYFTAHANKEGNVKFRLPSIPNQLYNVTITGHNLKKTILNFTTLKDSYVPEMTKLELLPTTPNMFDSIKFNIEARDNQSGIESVFILLSKNNFNSYEYYVASNGYLENESKFLIDLDKLELGDYQYAVVLRDYTNKTKLFYESSYFFTVEIPFTLILVIIVVSLIGLVGLTILYYKFVYKKKRAK